LGILSYSIAMIMVLIMMSPVMPCIKRRLPTASQTARRHVRKSSLVYGVANRRLRQAATDVYALWDAAHMCPWVTLKSGCSAAYCRATQCKLSANVALMPHPAHHHAAAAVQTRQLGATLIRLSGTHMHANVQAVES
jgi:hypothetical protein